jgi:hypothetical protein
MDVSEEDEQPLPEDIVASHASSHEEADAHHIRNRSKDLTINTYDLSTARADTTGLPLTTLEEHEEIESGESEVVVQRPKCYRLKTCCRRAKAWVLEREETLVTFSMFIVTIWNFIFIPLHIAFAIPFTDGFLATEIISIIMLTLIAIIKGIRGKSSK